jgi:citrate synthase
LTGIYQDLTPNDMPATKLTSCEISAHRNAESTLKPEKRRLLWQPGAVITSRTAGCGRLDTGLWVGSSGLTRPKPVATTARMRTVSPVLAGLPPVERFQALLPLAAEADLAGFDLRPVAVAGTGARILRFLTVIAAGEEAVGEGIAASLQQGWVRDDPQARSLIEAALILCADHELNVSSFTARCVASAGASPYQAVMAGLAALQGAKHGRNTERVEAFLREADSSIGPRAAIAGRLRRGETIPGFGHPLYPSGDPRGRFLIDATAAAYPDSQAVALARAVDSAVVEVTGGQPNIDYGLVTLAWTLNLPPGGPIALFALGRTIGWIGHAIEQYQLDRIIRPRARYIGEPPLTGPAES